MKYKLIIILLCIIGCCVSAEAKGVLPIIYSSGEHLVKVKNLPHDEMFTLECNDGLQHHVDLGIKHEQFSLFWVPLFNYGNEEYVLYTDTKIGDYDYTYASLTRVDIDYLRTLGIDIPQEPELPFWDAWGGKLIVLGLIVFFMLCGIFQKKEE